MPRKAHIDAPVALHHTIVRGIERPKIFRDDADRYDFIERLGNILERTDTECLAWALTPNHFHLKSMHLLAGRSGQEFNRCKCRWGVP